METVTKVTVEKNIDGLEFGYWNHSTEEFVPIAGAGMSDEEKEQAGELLGLTQPGLDALEMFASSVVEYIGADLADIWQRLDAAGIE